MPYLYIEKLKQEHKRYDQARSITSTKSSEMKEERLTPFDKSREHHERIDDQREKPELHWEFVVLYGLSAFILVLIIIFVLIMCSACSGLT